MGLNRELDESLQISAESCVCTCVHACVQGWGVAQCPGSRETAFCKYLISCLSVPHVYRVWMSPTTVCTPGDVFPEMLCVEKVRDHGPVGPAPPAHPTPFIPYHITGGGKHCHERSAPSGDQEAKGTIPPIFFHSNWFKNLMHKQSCILIRLLLASSWSLVSFLPQSGDINWAKYE